jgi:hypothetical protein
LFDDVHVRDTHAPVGWGLTVVCAKLASLGLVRTARFSQASQGTLDVALGDSEVADAAASEPTAEALTGCGSMLFLECAGPKFTQASPVTVSQAMVGVDDTAFALCRY